MVSCEAKADDIWTYKARGGGGDAGGNEEVLGKFVTKCVKVTPTPNVIPQLCVDNIDWVN